MKLGIQCAGQATNLAVLLVMLWKQNGQRNDLNDCGVRLDGFRVNTAKNVRKYAAETGFVEEKALKKGMEEKPQEFVEKGAEVYAKV